MLDKLKIEGFKSIKSAEIELKPINILIGANGVGKSNLLAFFDFLAKAYRQKLQETVSLKGVEKFLFNGPKETKEIRLFLSFSNKNNSYEVVFLPSENNLTVSVETLYYREKKWVDGVNCLELNLKNSEAYYAPYLRKYVAGIRKYHFHDTGSKSPFTYTSNTETDIHFLYAQGENLAAFLYNIKQSEPKTYNIIRETIKSIAPYFNDFYLEPNSENNLRLLWQSQKSEMIFSATDLSDGTLRFIALATLFLQPVLPQTIIIDEPELGLHPVAIAKLAGLIQSAAANGCQVIVATQSPDLISYFEPEDIIAVDLVNGASTFTRLESATLKDFLEEYTLGELWSTNKLNKAYPNF